MFPREDMWLSKTASSRIICQEPRTIVHIFNLSTWEVEAGGYLTLRRPIGQSLFLYPLSVPSVWVLIQTLGVSCVWVTGLYTILYLGPKGVGWTLKTVSICSISFCGKKEEEEERRRRRKEVFSMKHLQFKTAGCRKDFYLTCETGIQRRHCVWNKIPSNHILSTWYSDSEALR